jgi:hypothetical protein
MTAHPNSEVDTSAACLSHEPTVICKPALSDCGSRGAFGRYRFDNADIINLRQRAGRPSAVVAELFGVIACLNRRPIGSFENVAQLYASSSGTGDSGPSSRAVRLLRDLFIDVVNKRLQDVYRKHFQIHPPASRARHDQKIASLEATQADAQKIVRSYDWHWLADWLQLERIGESANSCLHRLSNFAFPVQSVNFRFTYHCNISCRHCYNSSGPHLKAQRIALEPMLALIAQMPHVGIGHLNLTGGEPFLYPDHLTALIAAGRRARLNGISINSNGYWALSADHAKKTLERLSAAGFMQGPADHLKVSTGVYHQEFVEYDRILTLARSHHEMFGKPLLVDCEMAPCGSAAREQICEKVRDAGLAERIDLYFRNVSPMGRGKELGGIASRSINSPCGVINQIVFDPDGSVRPCCGLNNENQGVVIGGLKAHRLSDLVKSMQNDPILQFLARNPMSAIFDHVAKPKNVNGYSDHCHLCQDALGDVIDKEPLQAKFFDRQQFYPFWFTLSGQEATAEFQAVEPCDDLTALMD